MEYDLQSEIIKGTVTSITYQNDDSGFTVLELENGDDCVTVVGLMPDVCAGEMLEIGGRFEVHQTYGKQFKAVSYEKVFPSDAAAMVRYLSGGVLKGIGPATAKKIVESFGADTLDVLMNDPEQVSNIKGISLSKAKEIACEMIKRRSMRDTIKYFTACGFSVDEAIKIFNMYHDKAVDKIKEDPYQICRAGIDMSFEKAENFALRRIYPVNFPGRVQAGILHIIKHNLKNGHTCIPESKLVPTVASFLSVDHECVNHHIDKLVEQHELVGCIVDRENSYFLYEYFFAEKYIAERLLMAAPPIDEISITAPEIAMIQDEIGIKLDKTQKSAIKCLEDCGVFILTGGPGTGKTTVLKAIIKVMENRDYRIMLAAPTGRAAKRITEITGVEAKTVHRLLEVERNENGEHYFSRNAENLLDCDVIIIDEMSMVDSLLFASLLKALPIHARIILVGDHNQLPSVGAGNVLRDLIESERFRCITLTTVFRQALESNIVVNSHKILNGRDLTDEDLGKDCFFVSHLKKGVYEYILDLCVRRLPERYGFDIKNGIQILCPSRKLGFSTEYINMYIQEAVNPRQKDKKEIGYQGFIIREGDKVMQTKNNYDIIWKADSGESGVGVFNGDIGYVEKIDSFGRTMTVRYDDKLVEYTAEDIFQLDLAYAITVHKSQGSEFECVILPILDTPHKLEYRNLLYTGFTRAKQLIIVIGDKEQANKMIENNRKTLRYTGLKQLIGDAENVGF